VSGLELRLHCVCEGEPCGDGGANCHDGLQLGQLICESWQLKERILLLEASLKWKKRLRKMPRRLLLLESSVSHVKRTLICVGASGKDKAELRFLFAFGRYLRSTEYGVPYGVPKQKVGTAVPTLLRIPNQLTYTENLR
jgi:hypothetical protein